MEKDVKVSVTGLIYSDIYEVNNKTSEFMITCKDSKRKIDIIMDTKSLAKVSSGLGIGSLITVEGRADVGINPSQIRANYILKL